MTAYRRHITVLGALLLVLPLAAQSYLGVSIAGHIPLPQDNCDLTQTKISRGGEAGGIYEWQSGLFMFQTGLHYAVLCPTMSVKDTQLEQAMIDTRGVPFTYRGELRNRTECITLGQLAIPVYAGITWRGWHMMAGLKLSVLLHAKSDIKAELQTVGDYEGRYYDYLEHMPNHGYHDFEPVSSTRTVPLNRVDVRICAETGYTFTLSPYSSHPSTLLRISAFAEYGMMNLRSPRLGADALPMTEPDYTHYMSLTMTPVYAADIRPAVKAHLLTTGIRFTILFPLPGTFHRTCNCYRNW